MLGPDVMLASRDPRSPDALIAAKMAEGWTFELKFDGIRAVIARRADGHVTITNRSRADITYRYPDLVARYADAGFVGMIDGEIVVQNAQGRPDFHAVHLRDMQKAPGRITTLARRHPAWFMPFDVLERHGEATTSLAQRDRRELLLSMVDGVPAVTEAGDALWDFVNENQLEGLIAKNPASRYRPVRSKMWLKIKKTHRVSVIAGGIVPGLGTRGAVGSVQMYLLDNGDLTHVGQVGSGLTRADQKALLHRVRDRVPTVVEVEYLDVSPTGQLRMPVFKGIRDDIDPTSCTIADLVTRV